jgi:pyoverdine/dityrosine biosynthesis protein Dit1
MAEETAEETAGAIAAVVESYLWRASEADSWEQEGKAAMVAKLREFVSNESPVEFITLGYPFKVQGSKPGEKVLSHRPDLAEETGLGSVMALCEEINSIYSHGSVFAIMCGGIMWHELLGIPEEAQQEYAEACIKMVSSSSSVQFKSLYEYYPGMNSEQIRNEIFKTKGLLPSREWALEKQGAADLMTKKKAEQFKQYAEENTVSAEGSGTAEEERAKLEQKEQEKQEKSLNMLRFSEAFNSFCDESWPDAVRFSIRAQSNAGPKYAINMAGSAQQELGHLDVPYHTVGVKLSDGRVVLVPNKHAKALEGAKLVFKDGQEWGYELTEASAEDAICQLKVLRAA